MFLPEKARQYTPIGQHYTDAAIDRGACTYNTMGLFSEDLFSSLKTDLENQSKRTTR